MSLGSSEDSTLSDIFFSGGERHGLRRPGLRCVFPGHWHPASATRSPKAASRRHRRPCWPVRSARETGRICARSGQA